MASDDIVSLGHFLYLSKIGSEIWWNGLNAAVDNLFIVFPWDKAELETGTLPSF